MLEAIALAGFATAAVLFLVFKFGKIRRILYFDKWIDLGSTFILSFILFGTYASMTTALIAGGMISTVLYFLKKIIGYDKPTIKGWKPATRPLDEVMK